VLHERQCEQPILGLSGWVFGGQGGRLMSAERITKLPKWAQRYIRELEERAARAEATTPWTEPGMEWFTLLKDSEPETIFLCSRDGTFPIAKIGRGDRVFVGRAKA